MTSTAPISREAAIAKLKELDNNKAKVWPAQNIHSNNHIAGLKPAGYGFVSEVELKATYRQWLRPVVVEDFDQASYVEGTKPERTKKEKKSESVCSSD